MKKKLILSTIIAFILLFGITVSAYFIKKVEGSDHGFSSNLEDFEFVEVSDFASFMQETYLYDGINTKFNSDDLISNNRKTIKFMNDIKMTSDLIINADCHIDLNSFELDLNGHNIVFRYHYSGLYAVYGGVITDYSVYDLEGNIVSYSNAGTIIVDCPHAIVNIAEGVVDNQVIVDIPNATDQQIVDSAMNMVLANIQNNGINNFYTINEAMSLGNDDNCWLDHNNGTECIYVTNDLDLIYNYYTYEGLTFEYSSTNHTVLSDNGNVSVYRETQTSDFTISISYNNAELEKTISVHVLSGAVDKAKASNTVLVNYLNKYYNEEKKSLYIGNAFLLPKKNTYFGSTYEYTLIGGTSFTINSTSPNDYFDTETYDDYFVVSLSKEITAIDIKSNVGGNVAGVNGIGLKGESTTLVDDNHSYAVNIVRQLYGNQIFIEKSGETYTERDDILIDPEEKGYTRIESITNTLINNEIDQTYILDETPQYDELGTPMYNYGKYQILRVNPDSDVKPYIGQSVFLAVTFVFKGVGIKEEITINVPIIYNPNVADDAGAFNAFDPYYVYYDREFTKANNNYGSKDFVMPLSLNGKKDEPTFTFIVYEERNGTYTKLNNGFFTQSTLNGSHTSFTSQTQMQVEINPYYIDKETLVYHFVYIPTYVKSGKIVYITPTGETSDLSTVTVNLDETQGKPYQYVSQLVIPGIVRFQSEKSVYTEEFNDKEFYKLVYNLLNDDTYSEGKFILTSTLNKNIDEIDFNNTGVGTLSFNSTDRDNYIDSIKGINLLGGLQSVKFDGITLGSSATTVQELTYVSQIENLRILRLTDTELCDCPDGNLSFPGDNNGILATLSNLSKLEELYLNDNQMYYFTELVDFASLKKVDIRNNQFTNGTAIIGGIITEVINSLYGTNGATNIAPITMLKTRDVQVEQGTGSTNEINEDIYKIVLALSSLEYQDRIDDRINLVNMLNTMYPNGTTTEVCNAYDLTYKFEIAGDNTIFFTFSSLGFDETDDGFKIVITYSYYYRHWITGDSEPADVTFEYEYKVVGY